VTHLSNDETDEAAIAIRAHHLELSNELQKRVLALRSTVQHGAPHGEAQVAVVAFLENELLPHAAAEEEALYPAGDTATTALLVRAMREEHRNLVAHVTALKATADGIVAATTASAILALFESHLYKENDLLIPALVADQNVSLGELLAGMHELIG
jgi:iron-sulfur cluster repair protein YtfE (RIC family)